MWVMYNGKVEELASVQRWSSTYIVAVCSSTKMQDT